MSISLDQLEAFIAAAHAGSQREAAKALGCTQSAVSKRITTLEAWLGKLLLTSDAPKELTESGKAFLPVAQQIVTLLEEARSQPSSASPPQRKSARDIQI
jgi:LysR family glycine cleavage system transcriptional activator